MINVKFESVDQRVNTNIQAYPDTPFNELIEKLYDIYPEYRKTSNYFIHKGNIIKGLTKKLKELNIDNNPVIINIIEEEGISESERKEFLRRKMLERQNKMRKKHDKENYDSSLKEEQKLDIKINNILEDMCIYGNIVKEEILIDKKNNPNKFIKTKDALKMEKTDKGIFALGLLASILEDKGIVTAIEKNENKDETSNEESSTCLQFIANGMIDKKKYTLHFDFGEERNMKLLTDDDEFEIFKDTLKQKLSKDYKTPKEKIVVTFPQKGSLSVDIIFQSDEFNNLNETEFLQKFKNEEHFKELKKLKKIHKDAIMGACKLSKNQLDYRGNRSEGWAINEKRGGKIYEAPFHWIGIGLRVLDKYENNKWIGMCNGPEEWCVAYHGVGDRQDSDIVKNTVGLIYKGGFKAGKRQNHHNCPDQFHPGKKVGDGVYCTPKIETAERYAGISIIDGQKYKTVLMVRVKPEALRHCDVCKDSKEPNIYWVVNGTNDEIRPYRILYRQV